MNWSTTPYVTVLKATAEAAAKAQDFQTTLACLNDAQIVTGLESLWQAPAQAHPQEPPIA